ncbi:AIM24 family protein [Rhodosalinus sp. FB01]|uniref:AIM24 family protein n=1 Tax=Rhodosalinus sp. FB01 TaxID=3239194 RepID=UPI0035252F86
MAEFTQREVEGMRQVAIDIADETVRARAGALSNMCGRIEFTPRLPGAGDLWRSLFTREARVRPWYRGTGRIILQPSLSGYHVLHVAKGERWLLEPGVYWASEGSVRLGLSREPLFASLWAGDGLLNWKTTLTGPGQVAINAPGPVETIDIDGEFRVQGRLVLGRTAGLRFRSVRSARFPRNFISGQKRLRLFEGTGKVMIAWTPYWHQYMFNRMTGEDIESSIFE